MNKSYTTTPKQILYNRQRKVIFFLKSHSDSLALTECSGNWWRHPESESVNVWFFKTKLFKLSLLLSNRAKTLTITRKTYISKAGHNNRTDEVYEQLYPVVFLLTPQRNMTQAISSTRAVQSAPVD